MYHCGFTCVGDIDMELNRILFNSLSVFLRNRDGELLLSDEVVGEVTLGNLLHSYPVLHHWSHEYSGSDAINLQFLPIGTNDLYLSQSGSNLLFTDLAVGTKSLAELANNFPSAHHETHEFGGSDVIDLLNLPIGGNDAYLSRNPSNELIFTDPITGTKSLSELADNFPSAHHETHEYLGSDSINLEYLPIGTDDFFLARSGNNLTLTDLRVGTKLLSDLARNGLPSVIVDQETGIDFFEIGSAIASLSSGCQLGVRKGDYALSDQIEIEISGISLIGENPHSTKISNESLPEGKHSIFIQDASNCLIKSIGFAGSNDACDLIFITNSEGIKLEDLIFSSSCGYGIGIVSSQEIYIDACDFNSCNLQISGSGEIKRVWVEKCNFLNNSQYFEAPVIISGSSIEACFFRGNSITNLSSSDCADFGLIFGANYSIISNSIFDQFLSGSCLISGNYNLITNNIFKGSVILSGSNNNLSDNIILGEIVDLGVENTISFN